MRELIRHNESLFTLRGVQGEREKAGGEKRRGITSGSKKN